MPYVFIDDGYPEAAEFDSNYVWFDPADPASLRALQRALPAGRNAVLRAAADLLPACHDAGVPAHEKAGRVAAPR
jgi:hypothetical protein